MDDQGDTALVRIIKNISASKNRYESAKILLSQSDADWGSQSWDEQHDPLRVAVKVGDVDMCYLLVCIGKMNPFSALVSDSEGKMGLKDKTPENEDNRQQILELLCVHTNTTPTPVQC
jgi:hypothetical protein